MATIGFIGAGNMAEALVKGVISAGVYKEKEVYASDISEERLKYLANEYGIETTSDNAQAVVKADIVVLSTKPQQMEEALASIQSSVSDDKLVISIAAGVKVEKITGALGDIAVVRVMPNTPALLGEGASALFANDKARSRLDEALKIFSAVGKAVVVDDEGMIDAVTAVSGSGPAYYFLLMEEMVKAAIELGLPEEVSKNLVLQTAKGASLLATERDKEGESPAELRRKVTSPGGTTEAALKVFTEGGFGPLVEAALKRACERSKELSG
ncbi:MAG: pyrroline-5-carboxylate reductase [Planctomycetota bacterium]|jgi:pyrroline-5-carboxylate reductase